VKGLPVIRYGFEGRNGKNRRHLVGDKRFFRLAKQITKRQVLFADNQFQICRITHVCGTYHKRLLIFHCIFMFSILM
jgi:hypothetical protein